MQLNWVRSQLRSDHLGPFYKVGVVSLGFHPCTLKYPLFSIFRKAAAFWCVESQHIKPMTAFWFVGDAGAGGLGMRVARGSSTAPGGGHDCWGSVVERERSSSPEPFALHFLLFRALHTSLLTHTHVHCGWRGPYVWWHDLYHIVSSPPPCSCEELWCQVAGESERPAPGVGPGDSAVPLRLPVLLWFL